MAHSCAVKFPPTRRNTADPKVAVQIAARAVRHPEDGASTRYQTGRIVFGTA